MVKKFANKSWFTLIEMIVSVTILSIIMLSIFVIYKNIVYANKKLELDRIIQENSRNIVETLATEIREKGINYNYYSILSEKLDYNGIGNTILAINNSWEYCMQKQKNACAKECYKDNKGCYLWKLDSDIKLSDENVSIKNLRFYISGNPDSATFDDKQEWKVTIVFDLWITAGKWLNSEIIKDSSIHLQTTIGAKFYKNMN